MIATGFSAYLAGSILTCLTAFLIYIISTKTIQNRYTRIAMGELLVALLLRIASCFFYGTASTQEKEQKLNSRLFDQLMVELPYYLLLQVAFSMLFGWLSLYKVLKALVDGCSQLDFESVSSLQRRHLCVYISVTATVYLILIYQTVNAFFIAQKNNWSDT